MRVKQAADYLDVTPGAIRKWCNSGELSHTFNGAGQRILQEIDLENFKRSRMGIEPIVQESVKIFYARCSGNSDISIDNQIDKLTQSYGEPNQIFSDKSSGLNDNRKGLNKLFKFITNSDSPCVVYITNKDRLTRFGFNYLKFFFDQNNTVVEVLDSDETKEPLEVLLQDFMSLLASFSGKFYRLRGWKQQKQFLNDVAQEVDKHV